MHRTFGFSRAARGVENERVPLQWVSSPTRGPQTGIPAGVGAVREGVGRFLCACWKVIRSLRVFKTLYVQSLDRSDTRIGFATHNQDILQFSRSVRFTNQGL